MFQHLLTPLGVSHFWVPLHPGQFAHPALERGDGSTRGAGQHMEALGSPGDGVPVAHPHVEGVGKGGQQLAAVLDRQRGAAVLTLPRLGHRAPQRLRHRLEAVADSEHRDPRLKQRGIKLRSLVSINGGGPSRQNDGGRPPGDDLIDRRVRTDDLGIDVSLTDAPGDELRVLGAKVHDEDQIMLGSHGRESNGAPEKLLTRETLRSSVQHVIRQVVVGIASSLVPLS